MFWLVVFLLFSGLLAQEAVVVEWQLKPSVEFEKLCKVEVMFLTEMTYRQAAMTCFRFGGRLLEVTTQIDNSYCWSDVLKKMGLKRVWVGKWNGNAFLFQGLVMQLVPGEDYDKTFTIEQDFPHSDEKLKALCEKPKVRGWTNRV